MFDCSTGGLSYVMVFLIEVAQRACGISWPTGVIPQVKPWPWLLVEMSSYHLKLFFNRLVKFSLSLRRLDPITLSLPMLLL